MRRLGSRLTLLTLGLLSLCAFAQESPPPAQQPAPPAQSPAPPVPNPVPAQNPPQASPDASDDVFIPTEELAADEEVTFPVDI